MPTNEPPSRGSNPFATCWTRPGALPFLVDGPGADPNRVIQHLAQAGWRGQLVGPHGSGKSTLLKSLAQRLLDEGVTPCLVDARRPAQVEIDSASRNDLLMIEGFERLGWRQRFVWLSRLRKSRAGFVLTTHRPLRGWRAPAVVARLSPGEAILAKLFDRLVAVRPSPVTLGDARRSHCLHRGNLRAVWFDLYNLHESLCRTERTAPVTASYVLPAAVS